MEKWFFERQAKHSSNGARRRGMARRGMKLTLEVDKWEMGWDAMYLRWAYWGAEHAHGLCALFPLFYCPQKVRNGNCDRWCKGELIPKKSSLSGWSGVPSHKCMRVRNSFKSDDLLFKRTVFNSDYVSKRSNMIHNPVSPWNFWFLYSWKFQLQKLLGHIHWHIWHYNIRLKY